MSRIALVRKPGPRLNEGLVDHIERVPVDLPLALEQWQGYVEALHAAGWQTREVAPADDCPDAVFVEDSVVLFRNVAVSTHPGAPSRRGEIAATRAAAEELGCSLNRITAPGTLDGGDVLKVGDTVYVGQGGRTSPAGIAQLRAILSPLGATVVAVPVTRVLHLKTAVTALPDGTVIGFPDFVDDPALFERFLPVPEEHGTAVLCLSDSHLLMSASAPRTAELIGSLGYQVTTVAISEFEKLEGCVTCLSVRLPCLS
ncbi:dimethylargininase [Acidipropionibacterium jensenii]|uniref:dimethylargininase n=2 Tax=Acidipropionibacterium jensenii TaxID=1749 RepID=UPI002647D38B|nr:dimethylargininase [Acidipropionibacterium jensenii]MDN5976508.1 arginine deiminase family protein [Acidipropionibacterium jensenii]MDN5995099.1 arginine deiminase family protein [Acidipropionibacterium jensenii]MDN6426171.1 arginine deiminase family protein [Acidipropionibacterium jensenii]MDN6440602.1 arginine deiminase family protein [Acidipropionibacterium jensenii]MDN6479823.1 arginine deiminase family protein [Acidipropionibacterium jensenii]